MTLQDEAEVRRTSVGTKVLMVGCGVLAVLGSFWTIVWFIRSYVDPHHHGADGACGTRERADGGAHNGPDVDHHPGPGTNRRDPLQAPCPRAAEAPPPAEPRVTNAISDRWMPATPPPAAEPPAAEAQTSAPAALAAPADTDPPVDEVAESSVPAISGSAPLPRPKPTQTAAVRPRNSDPPASAPGWSRTAERVDRGADNRRPLPAAIEHDPEKWVPVFGQDHAQ